jgi:Flp pilus assembly protein protease CpaA
MISLQEGLTLLFGAAAVVEDLRWRTISNWTTGGAMVAGIVYHAATGGWSGTRLLASWSNRWLLRLSAFLSEGRHGRRRHQIDGRLGSLLGGAAASGMAVLFAAGVGGLLACVVLAFRWPRTLLRRRKAVESPFIPYAPAIAAGAWSHSSRVKISLVSLFFVRPFRTNPKS